MFLCPNIKIAKTWTVFSNNVNTTIRKCSSRAFIWVVTPLGFVWQFRIWRSWFSQIHLCRQNLSLDQISCVVNEWTSKFSSQRKTTGIYLNCIVWNASYEYTTIFDKMIDFGKLVAFSS